MRRFSMFLSTVAVMLLGILGLQMQPVAIAQEATPTTMNRHPLVGTWLLDTDADDPANTPDVVVFTGGGAYISVDAEGFPSLGVWEASGERTATLTIVSPGMEEEAFAGTFMIRATIDVDEVGDAFGAVHRRVRRAGWVQPRGVRPGDGHGHADRRRGHGGASWAARGPVRRGGCCCHPDAVGETPTHQGRGVSTGDRLEKRG